MAENDYIIAPSDLILITGSSGFIGSRVVETLLRYGFTNLRCLVRPSSDLDRFNKIIAANPGASIEIIKGNLQSHDDCKQAAGGAALIYHLAAGRGEKSFPDAYMNTVIATRNLLDAVVTANAIKRFVNISSFTVYSNQTLSPGGLLDESCALEDRPHLTGEAYCYAKARQEELVSEYVKKHQIPVVTLRPGAVYGPGNKGITDRVGISTFGIFLHLGGSNRIPLSYVDNCAEAIVLAGLKKGVEGEIFNIVDDDLPTSRRFLALYKKNAGYFKSIYLPRPAGFLLCYAWEKYSAWSKGQLPPAFNRKRWAKYWKGNIYSNSKLKNLLGWKPRIDFEEATARYFAYQKRAGREKWSKSGSSVAAELLTHMQSSFRGLRALKWSRPATKKS